MICDVCGVRPAQFRITTIINGGETNERNLCAICMAKQHKNLPGIDTERLAPLLSKVIDYMRKNVQPMLDEDRSYEDLVCDVCGTSYASVRKHGRVGCPNCYKAFHAPLEILFQRRYGTTQHTGRIPETVHSTISIKMNIESLRIKLQKAIQAEEYEQAAKLRDAIRSLEAKLAREQEESDGIRVEPPIRLERRHNEEGDEWL